MEKDNALTNLSKQFIKDFYPYYDKLLSKKHNALAENLLGQAIATDYATNFAATALSREKFIYHLEEGYYASGRVEELLKLVAELDFKCDNHEALSEDINKIHRMLAASIKTAKKNDAEAA